MAINGISRREALKGILALALPFSHNAEAEQIAMSVQPSSERKDNPQLEKNLMEARKCFSPFRHEIYVMILDKTREERDDKPYIIQTAGFFAKGKFPYYITANHAINTPIASLNAAIKQASHDGQRCVVIDPGKKRNFIEYPGKCSYLVDSSLVINDEQRDVAVYRLSKNLEEEALARGKKFMPLKRAHISKGDRAYWFRTPCGKMSESLDYISSRIINPKYPQVNKIGSVSVAGMPIGGESGGPIFDPRGNLLGLMHTAEIERKEGFFLNVNSLVDAVKDYELTAPDKFE